MNTSAINLHEIIKISNRYTKTRVTPLWVSVARWTGNRKALNFPIFYSYLKWVDDQIDEEIKDKKQSHHFLEDQWKVVLGMGNPVLEVENLGEYIGRYSRNALHDGFRSSLEQFFESFYLDIRRRDHWNSTSEIYTRNRYFGNAMLTLAESCFAAPGILEKDLKLRLGEIYIYSDMYLDLREDLDNGYINVPVEWVRDSDALDYPTQELLERDDIKKRVKEEVLSLVDTASDLRIRISEIDSASLRWFLSGMLKKRIQKLNRVLLWLSE